jgi:hypothetical protein
MHSFSLLQTTTNSNKKKLCKEHLIKSLNITFLVEKLGITRAWDSRKIVVNCNLGNWELLELEI